MTKPALVLIHGRSQGGKDSVQLKEQWLVALRDGLGQDAGNILAGVDIRFPFYGDELDAWVQRAEVATPADARGPGDGSAVDSNYLAFQQAVAAEILARHGLDAAAQANEVPQAARGAGERSPEWVQGLLRLLDNVPGVTGLFIATIMRDVYLYLRHPAAQAAIDRIVTPTLSGRCVVVAHSLGTVVAYRLLKAASVGDAPLLLTLGSPLGIGPVRAAIVPRKAPSIVARWINGYDDRDDVALYPLGQGRFQLAPAMPIEDIGGIDNRTANHHGIVEYLNKPPIARRIAEALQA
jgi:hypothetical protein